MSRWPRRRRRSEFSYFESAPKKPPPPNGIKLKKSGITWWGDRWIEALTKVLSGDSARLSRGRTYARAGRVHDLVVKGGQVTAKVTGSRATPYKVTIKLGQLSEATWEKAIVDMAERAQFAAELLAGRMPQAIGEVLHGERAGLFPAQRSDLSTTCSCPDWGDPCKHVAATHYVLGEALDRDPFLLFELRGRSKEQVLAALRGARSGEIATPLAEKHGTAELEMTTVKLEKLSAAEYDSLRAPLGEFHFAFDAEVKPGAMLRQLGAPAAWSFEASPVELLEHVVHAASERARRLALADVGEGRECESPEAEAKSKRPRGSVKEGTGLRRR